MNDNQKKFLKELAQLFEKYDIASVYVTDKDVEFKSHEDSLSFQSYKDETFFNLRTYESEYDTTEEE